MGKKNQKREEELYKQTGAQSQALMQEGQKYRGQAGDFWSGITKGGPEATRVLAPQIQATKRGYKQAREQAERTLPRGGAMDAARRDLTIGEGADVGRLYTDKMDEAVNQLANLGVFGTQTGMQGGLNTGGAFGNLASRQREQFMGGLTGAAKVAGKLAFCSESFKEEIVPFHEYEDALRVIVSQPLVKFRYRGGLPVEGYHAGIIVEESDEIFRQGKMLDVPSVIAYLIASVKVQQKQIESLRKRLEQAEGR